VESDAEESAGGDDSHAPRMKKVQPLRFLNWSRGDGPKKRGRERVKKGGCGRVRVAG